MHHFNEESLRVCYHELGHKKAIGSDGVDKESYGAKLEENLQNLVSRMKSMSYRPGNIREVEIPKEGSKGRTRTLGISNFEDKLIQKMMHKVLESTYEPLFLGSSFGFRTGLGCHDAIRSLVDYLYKNELHCVIDIDLANFFGSIDQELLMQIIAEKIKDKKLIRYIKRMFKAGILSKGELVVQDLGVIQGGLCKALHNPPYAKKVIMLSNMLHLCIFNNLPVFYFA
jgi:retron-type reverse transcriptase